MIDCEEDCNMSGKRRVFSMKFKLEVIQYAEKHGNRAAEKEFDVIESNVRYWRKQKEKIESNKSTLYSFRGCPPRWPELEAELSCWVVAQKSTSQRVNLANIALRSRQLADQMAIPEFRASHAWIHKFLKRNNLTLSSNRSKSQSGPLPKEWPTNFPSFLDYVGPKIDQLDLRAVVNMDEVPVTLELPGSAESTSFTAVLAATASGHKLKPMAIFKRYISRCGHFLTNVYF